MYWFREYDGRDYRDYSDTLNASGFPAHATTLFVDVNGSAVATRVERPPWKVVFLAFPYEGLSPDGDRQILLSNSIEWLKQ